MLLNPPGDDRLRVLKVRAVIVVKNPTLGYAARAQAHTGIDVQNMASVFEPKAVRVLVIEDDLGTAEEIQTELASHGFHVERVANGGDGLARAMRQSYDVITLDRMLPDMDGLNVVAALRRSGIATPVLVISALSDVDERVRGLRAGGDDYLTKPFASDEMAARVEVLSRRQSQAAQLKLVFEGVTLDRVAHRARCGERDLELKPTEYQLLDYMMRNAGHVVTRTMILEAVWGYHFDPGTNVIEVHVAGLRKKLSEAGCPDLIHTIRGSGYVFGHAQ